MSLINQGHPIPGLTPYLSIIPFNDAAFLTPVNEASINWNLGGPTPDKLGYKHPDLAFFSPGRWKGAYS